MAEQLCCAERLSWQNPVMKKLVIRSLAATSAALRWSNDVSDINISCNRHTFCVMLVAHGTDKGG